MALSTIFLGSLVVALCMVMKPRLPSMLIGGLWARLNTYITPVRVTIIGRENIDPAQSYVICSNHQSQFDILVLYGWLEIDFKWVMKQELRKIPFLGVACEKLGHIFIDRSATEKALASINAAKKKIVNGTSVLFFPEGTRSKDGQMLRFKKGAFKIALDLDLPILPITITGTRDVLPAGTLNLYPGKATMIIHKPVDVSKYGNDVSGLMKKTREIIQYGLDKQRPF